MVQTTIQPTGERLVRVMGPPLGHDQRISLDSDSGAIPSQDQGVAGTEQILCQAVVAEASVSPSSVLTDDVPIRGDDARGRRIFNYRWPGIRRQYWRGLGNSWRGRADLWWTLRRF